jgi:hypothetical protein
MADDPLKREFESIWSEVRKAFAEYRLDDVKKHVDLPAGAPVPNRGQAKEFAAQLPDLAQGRFLKIGKDGDRAGYYAQFPDSTLLVIRFQKSGKAWKLVPAPDTLSLVSPAQAIETEPALALWPSNSPMPASPKETAPSDSRPEPVIRKELEGIWKKVRAEGPDLARGQFLKLGWHPEKPHLVGYYGQVNVSDAKTSTIVLIVFVREDGAWKFVPGPGAITVVQIPHAGRPAILKLIETDPRLTM